ncbi:MAG: translation initiation factor IF-2, partial [Gemmataceae bacterium]
MAHAHSESSVLSSEDTERIKADLDEQAHRAALMRRETVVETSAGKVVEKRLNATVMRRRHTEPEPSQAAPVEAELFHFEVEQSRDEEPFVAPVFEVPTPAESDLAELPALEMIEPVHAETAQSATDVETEIVTPAAELTEPQTPTDLPPEENVNGIATKLTTAERQPELDKGSGAAARTLPAEVKATPAQSAVERESHGRPVPARSSPTTPPSAASGPRGAGTPVPRTSESLTPGRTINLTGAAHASAPSLDDGPRGPKVLGKIDLRKPAPRPAPPTTARPGTALGRPAGRPSPAGGMPEPFAPPPSPDQVKPGARAIKKKKVVKKGTTDVAAEREMRGMRVLKKRRALPGKEQRKTEITTPKASKRVVRITEGVTVGDLARNMGVKAAEIIKKLMGLGVMSTLNQVLDVDTATLVASDFGYSVENVAFDAESAIAEEGEEVAEGEAVTRPPVVTVMGHVDHGKTSLLDAIRHTSVTEREFGGITQHIGAYTVEANGRKLSFVDTPGHEAFTAMRARGAKVTDIVILVVAADEGVMPQTVEAINHARAAGVPIIVAINKIDRPEANVDRVKQQLTEYALIPEDYGGDTIVAPVSARTREGIDHLLEMILLQADLMDLKANPARSARGTVVESQLDRGRGPVATVLIQEGTLHQGEPFVCGMTYGRVRAMLNHLGQRVTEAGPSTPVEIFGLSSVPEPGTAFIGVADEAKARQVAEFRHSKQREGVLQKTSRVSLESLSERMLAGEVKELRVIIKGDVNGSVEAVADSLQRLSTEEVKLDLIHKSVGAISETDVSLASASKAIIIG